jgi:hypothetical protein
VFNTVPEYQCMQLYNSEIIIEHTPLRKGNTAEFFVHKSIITIIFQFIDSVANDGLCIISFLYEFTTACVNLRLYPIKFHCKEIKIVPLI